MIRNIANRYTPEEVLKDMFDLGFEGAFDFFYLPTDFGTKKNKGYGFINLRSPALALAFRRVFEQRKLERYTTHKLLHISAAQTQGFSANCLEQLARSKGRVENPWFRPMLFVPGCPGAGQASPWRCLPLSRETFDEALRLHVLFDDLERLLCEDALQ